MIDLSEKKFLKDIKQKRRKEIDEQDRQAIIQFNKKNVVDRRLSIFPIVCCCLILMLLVALLFYQLGSMKVNVIKEIHTNQPIIQKLTETKNVNVQINATQEMTCLSRPDTNEMRCYK